MKVTALSVSLFVIAFAALLGVLALPSLAPARQLKIFVPVYVKAHETISVQVTARADEQQGEQVGFLQVEFSTDGGATWNKVCYDENLGPRGDCMFEINVGPSSTLTLVRARAAFRGSEAGDVDLEGKPINWNGSWFDWSRPPSVQSSIKVG